MTIYPVRISFKTACQILDVSRETLNNIIKLDPNFPQKIKAGTSRQSISTICKSLNGINQKCKTLLKTQMRWTHENFY